MQLTQSAVLLRSVVCLSVCLSVRPSVCNLNFAVCYHTEHVSKNELDRHLRVN